MNLKFKNKLFKKINMPIWLIKILDKNKISCHLSTRVDFNV